jgi:MerR family copper efflux transcriptional regulator
MTKVPIACTLSVDAAVDRVAEWKELLSTKVHRIDHDRNQATLTFLGAEALMAVTDLAEREKVCCPFFQFSIELDAIETRLRIGVPADAEPILNELLGIAPSHFRPE